MVSKAVCVPVTVKFPVIVVLAFKAMPPEPLGSVISAFEGDIIVDPTNEKSPTLTQPNDKVPDPSVFKN